ncbi:MAG: helix-turn-helix domain-containing protein [Planctomycetota bacterium]|nr:helix-turn-helix domain-containing protein [Planctomycetota bacterium]
MRAVIQAIGHPVRAAMLQQIAEESKSFRELEQTLDIRTGQLRYHAKKLADLTILEIDQSGKHHRCRLGKAVVGLKGPTERVLTITAGDGSTISFPLESLSRE